MIENIQREGEEMGFVGKRWERGMERKNENERRKGEREGQGCNGNGRISKPSGFKKKGRCSDKSGVTKTNL